MADEKSVDFSVTANAAQLVAEMAKAAAASRESAAAISNSFAQVGSVLKNVMGIMAGLTAIAAGGKMFGSAISESVSFSKSVGGLAIALGVSNEKALALKVTADRLGISQEALTTASDKLAKQVISNGGAFEKMGINVKDSNGHYRTAGDLLPEISSKLVAIHNPMERNIVGQQLFGKSWGEIRGILKLTAEQMAYSEQRIKDLNISVDPSAAKRYSQAMADLKLVGESLSLQIGNALIPVLTKLAAYFAGEGKNFAQGFTTVLQTLAATVETLWTALQSLGSLIGAVGAAVAAVAHGDFSAAKEIMSSWVSDTKESVDKIKEIWSHAYDAPKNAEGPKDVDLGGSIPDFSKDKAQSQMRDFENELSLKRDQVTKLAAEDGKFYEMSKTDERAYWVDKLSQVQKGGDDYIAIQRKIADMDVGAIKDSFAAKAATLQDEESAIRHNFEAKRALVQQEMALYIEGTREYESAKRKMVEIDRQELADRTAVQNEMIAAEQWRAENEINIEKAALAQQVELGVVTGEQRLAKERELTERLYQLKVQDIQRRIILAAQDPDADPATIQRLIAQREQLETQGNAALAQIAGQGAKAAAQPWLAISDQIANSMGRMATSLLTNWRNLGRSMAQISMQMGQAIIQEAIVKPQEAKLAAWLKEKVYGDAEIDQNAGKAGAGAAASQANIPIVGPILALAAMATVFGAVKGMHSAASGYDIPAGVNPLTQLHQREMVLPAKYADTIREMAEARSAGQSIGGGGGASAVHLHMPQALDAADVRKFMQKHAGTLAKAVAGHVSGSAFRPDFFR